MMQVRSRGAGSQLAPPVISKDTNEGYLKTLSHSRNFRRSVVVVAAVLLYVIAATLAPRSGTDFAQRNATDDSKQTLVKEQIMNNASDSSEPGSQASHHVTLNISQKNGTTNSTTRLDSSSTSSGNSNSSADVVINGRHITVPQNGSLHQTIEDEGGTSHVDINVDSSGSGSTNSSSTMNIDINSNGVSTSDTGGP